MGLARAAQSGSSNSNSSPQRPRRGRHRHGRVSEARGTSIDTCKATSARPPTLTSIHLHITQARPQGLEWTIAAAVEDDDDNDHGLTLDLSFRQGSGEYATTLVREVLGGESETYLPPWGGGGGEEGEGSNSGDGE